MPPEGLASAVIPGKKGNRGKLHEHLKLALHAWLTVLIMGTIWRVLSYHFIASSNTSLAHLGRAMATQY